VGQIIERTAKINAMMTRMKNGEIMADYRTSRRKRKQAESGECSKSR
jgi:hypothetical protein